MKITFNQKLLIVALMALFIFIAFNVNVYAEDSNFTLNKESMTIRLNGTGYLSYSGGSGSITWESSDPTIATVDNGTVTGLNIGTTTITATRGEETATCTVTVVYNMITIGGNSYNSVSNVNLVLNEHPTENLYATVEDDDYEVVTNAKVEWSSSDTSIVTVDKNTGTITGLKAGTATITASAAGVTDTCEVKVVNGPTFTDFSKAKYELLFDVSVDFKITGITPNADNSYYYIITPTNTKPTISKTNYGALNNDNNIFGTLSHNTQENRLYAHSLDKYVELNQDLYLWVIEETKLEESYYTNPDTYISYSIKMVVEGEKLTRPKLPQLNSIIDTVILDSDDSDAYNSTNIQFRFPNATENRKFKIKIGKVTDNSILRKIQNNDYSGITDLLTYAKNNSAVYTSNLTTTYFNNYTNKKPLFDGFSLLQDDAYYYIYVEFDDENGKYYPIEGVTLGQAWINSDSTWWSIYAYTNENFEWNDVSGNHTTPEQTEPEKTEPEQTDPGKEEPEQTKPTQKEEDKTVATGKIPQTGTRTFITTSVIILVAITCILFYKKYNKYKDIN